MLIRQSSSPGDTVLDPFMGSGAFGVAAAGLGRNFAGTDTSAEAVRVTRTRLTAAGGQPGRLFLGTPPETWAPRRDRRTIRGGEAA